MGKIIAQVVNREFRDATIKPVKGFSGVETIQTVYERYKIWIPSQMDDNIPVDQLPWARKKTMNSGLGGFQSFEPVIQTGSFVMIVEDDNGDWVIDEVLPNVVCDEISSTFVFGRASSGFSPTYYQGLQKVPTTSQTPDGAGLVCELPQTPESSLADEQQNLPNTRAPETILTACKKVNLEGVNKEIENAIKDVEKLRTGLLGKDSFLTTSKKFIDQEVLARVNQASGKISEWTAWLVQEIRKYVIRKVNAGINDLTGNAPLSARYLVNEAKDKTLSTISCFFIKILANLESLISQALNALINKLVNTATCLIENFISNFIGQLVAQLTELINAALRPISSLLGSVISFTSEILDFVISILDLLKCDTKNICPQVEKWNPLNGPQPPKLNLNFNSIFESAKGVANSFRGVLNIPDNLENFDFAFDAQAALNATLNGCGVGPQSCGVPNVVFWGGSGSGATGNAVLNSVGDIIGIDIVTPGFYNRAPIITFEDNCGNGIGAVGIPVLGDEVEVEVVDDTINPITRHEIRFDEDGEISICDATDIVITVAGAAGGNGLNGNLGNAGRVGKFPYASGQTIASRTLKIQVGKKGVNGTGGRSSYAQGGSGSNGGGGGGGASAVYDEELGRYTIVAAGGGGGAASGGGKSTGIGVGLGFGRVRDAMSSDSSSAQSGKNASNGGGGGGGGSQPSNYPGVSDGGNGTDGNGGASGFDTRVADFSYDGYSNVGDGYVLVSFTGRICQERQTTTERGRPVTDVVMTNTGYGYLPSPDGSKGGMGRVWADRCQTIVQRVNGDWDTPYSEGDVIRLYFGDKITLPGQGEVVIDCDFNAIELPGCIETGEKYCYKDMSGFDDGAGVSLEDFNIKSMVGFDDFRGSRPELTYPVSIEHQKLWDELAATERGRELFEEDRKLIEEGGIPDFGRPDQFGFHQDYYYARELGFSDSDIRYYLEGFYSKILGKRLGPLMRLKLEDPNFGPLPKALKTAGTAGIFDCETDYPYALSLGFNDKDIRFYLENVYTGQIDECMQRKLNDSNFGRVDYHVDITAPGCPPDQQGGDYDVISEIGNVYVEDGGFGYQPGDTATVLDCAGNPDAAAKVEITVDTNGTITSARVISPGTNYACIPEIILNTDTGYNARLIPVLKFRRAEDIDVPPGTQVLQVIDCVGKV